LMKMVYVRLAQDFFRAAAAARANDIEQRCAASEHALLLLAHLESWVALEDTPQLAATLRQFYAMLRVRTVQLQAQPDPASFEQLSQFVMETHAAWQSKEEQLLTLKVTPDLRPESVSEKMSFRA
jgi:flagellin-specific chaperone FliS